MKSQMKRYTGQGASVPVEVGCVTPPAPPQYVFTNLEILRTLYYRDFYGGFITRA